MSYEEMYRDILHKIVTLTGIRGMIAEYISCGALAKNAQSVRP